MEQIFDKIAKASIWVKVGAILVAIVLMTALNYFLMIQPIEEALVRQESQQRTLDTQLAEKQAIAQNLNERRREMDILEQKLAEALTELPEGRDLDELLSQLNDIAKKSGLEISKIEPGAEVSATFFAKIPIRMTVTGNYHEIGVFLQEIANMRRIVNINGLKLATPQLKNDKVILSSDFLATTFRFLDQPKN